MKLKNKYKEGINTVVDYCIIGSGNIALRHYKNIKHLDKKAKIIFCKRSKSKLHNDFIENDIEITKSIHSIKPRSSKSLAVICSPAISHIKDAIILAEKGFHILIEKPLSHNSLNIKKLINIMNKKNTISLVGYNMRFTDRFEFLLKFLKNKDFNDIKKINVYAHTDFRVWRKNKDYKDTVSFKKILGGGVINELSHEIDYIIFLFDEPNSVDVKSYKTSLKNIDVEYNIKATFKYNRYCFDIDFQLNMLSKKNNRYFDIVLDDSNINIDHIANTIRIDDDEIMFNDTLDDSYVREINNIKKSISRNTETKLSIKKCCSTQKVLDAMHMSLKNNKKVNIRV